ncbi:MAG: hypothetical protein KKH88_00100 [Nanoarchaeota archaeon]|nr:hypothetical protein [Nanoarchaeota archaeon]MBU1444922.1 hypothetical protein [Nanoarchaeota archaeon]MBU2406712.1 hypothetical protein [Nanoarchaeota archaeon]MBU2420586.1 hypothetical protein [Nanoarchaeota archaeon]MBU2475591.1 hypothetical protein [Nanoarchaeota archaeon]
MVDEKLINFIKDGFDKEYTEEELKSILHESGWKPGEIDEAFIEINKEKEIFKKKPGERSIPHEVESTPTEIKPIEDPTKELNPDLLDYVKKALDAGYPKPQIRSALLAKDWPNNQIDLAFSKLEHPIRKLAKPIIEKKPVTKPEESIFKKEKSKVNGKKIAFYIIAFLIVSAIFSFTFILFYYVDSIMEYEVVDPTTGQLKKGICLEEQCTDMKEHAMQEVKTKVTTSILYGSGAALLVVALHYFVPFKNLFVWLINIVYLVFLGVIANMWVVFNKLK